MTDFTVTKTFTQSDREYKAGSTLTASDFDCWLLSAEDHAAMLSHLVITGALVPVEKLAEVVLEVVQHNDAEAPAPEQPLPTPEVAAAEDATKV